MRLAYFSPLNPRRSGISDYSEALLPHLGRLAEVEVFLEDYRPENHEIEKLFPVRDWHEFEAEHAAGRFDAVLYHMGNNPYHVYVRDLALRIPGVMVLHEFNMHYLAADSTVLRNDWDTYMRELERDGGPTALEHARRAQRGEVTLEFERFAMNRSMIEASQGLIVHSHYVEQQVRKDGHTLPIAVIPHGVAAPCVDPGKARQRLELDGQPLFGVFGFLKHYKRINSIIQAFARLARYRPEARLILVGEEHPHYPLRPLIRDLGQEERIRILGHVPLNEFVEYMAACDVCLNLRYPTAGESSGSLLREMALARPVIVSDIGAFSEIPDNACIKIPAGPEASLGEPEWLFEYMNTLVNRPDLARALGQNAAAYTARECSWERAAGDYVDFLERFTAPHTSPTPIPQQETEAHKETVEECILAFSKQSPEGENYARTHMRRFVHTMGVVPPGRTGKSGAGKSVLEMGCYMQMTPALNLFLGYEDVRGCYFGPSGQSNYKTVRATDGREFSCHVDLFDAEKDIYPYEDSRFDTVLCCELLEHLYNDPMHMMVELNRILKPGGHLVLTTPNITNLRALHAVLLAWHPGFFHTYVKPNPDGSFDPRHNREYAPRDMQIMFPAAGFEVERIETDWYREPDAEDRKRNREMIALLRQRGDSLDLREDCLFVIGRKTGPVRDRWPRGLYEN
jgi:glycosyltransferase involved in cell wall biosynthesis/SAM-dependent methyltransferase